MRHPGAGFSVQRRAALYSKNPQLSCIPVQRVMGDTDLVGGDTLSVLHASGLAPSSLPRSHPLVCPIACAWAEGSGLCGGFAWCALQELSVSPHAGKRGIFPAQEGRLRPAGPPKLVFLLVTLRQRLQAGGWPRGQRVLI